MPRRPSSSALDPRLLAPEAGLDHEAGRLHNPPGRPARAAGRRLMAVSLEVVNETTEQPLDPDKMIDAVATLLVRYHRSRQLAGAGAST